MKNYGYFLLMCVVALASCLLAVSFQSDTKEEPATILGI